MVIRTILFYLALALSASGVGIRIATYNIGANLVVPQNGSVYFDYGIGPPGQPGYDAVRAVLLRINADVVALQEIHTADLSSGNLATLAASLSYHYTYAAPTTNAIDSTLRVVFFSKFPLISSTSIGSAPGAREITRLFPAVKIDVPGTTLDPLFISAHLKSGTATSDRFRRALEMKRLSGYLTTQGITAEANFIILGDFNPSATNTTFQAPPSGLPANFVVGADVTYPFHYYTNMLASFSSPMPVKLDPRHLNNSPSTFGTNNTTGNTLDLFLVSPAIASRPLASEVYNSQLDVSNDVGLPKNGSPPAPNTSLAASDHYALFADIELDQTFPTLAASLTAASVVEGSAPGTVSLSVSLPAARATDTTLTLASDVPAAALLTTDRITIPAGSTSASLPITTPRNFITDGTRSVAFTVSGINFTPATALLQVTDADPPYIFTAVGQTLAEDFTGFIGSQNPAPWATAGGPWRGADQGAGTLPGFRSYGTAGDGSLGFLAGNLAGTASASFFNATTLPLTAVEVSFTAEQWRAMPAGRPDTLHVELITEAGPQPIPALTFTATHTLVSAARSAIISGLTIPPGEHFTLQFTFSPAALLPSDIFFNEFHYDNIGTDTNEFIEIIVGPGFAGQLSDINVSLYNGDIAANAVVYNTLNLATDFISHGDSGGYRIFSTTRPANGLQNGPRDGFSIVDVATSQVLQLLSYGGVFTADGISSTAIPVSESNSSTALGSSIGLSSSGWAASSGSNTKGALNTGQALAPVPLPQGIAIDHLSVTFLQDGDLDGVPDLLDLNDDNDLLTDADEVLFGSDPSSAGSFYQATFSQQSPTSMVLSFATLTGRRYRVESSENLVNWLEVSNHSGTGTLHSIAFEITPSSPKLFYRVAATYE